MRLALAEGDVQRDGAGGGRDAEERGDDAVLHARGVGFLHELAPRADHESRLLELHHDLALFVRAAVLHFVRERIVRVEVLLHARHQLGHVRAPPRRQPPRLLGHLGEDRRLVGERVVIGGGRPDFHDVCGGQPFGEDRIDGDAVRVRGVLELLDLRAHVERDLVLGLDGGAAGGVVVLRAGVARQAVRGQHEDLLPFRRRDRSDQRADGADLVIEIVLLVLGDRLQFHVGQRVADGGDSELRREIVDALREVDHPLRLGRHVEQRFGRLGLHEVQRVIELFHRVGEVLQREQHAAVPGDDHGAVAGAHRVVHQLLDRGEERIVAELRQIEAVEEEDDGARLRRRGGGCRLGGSFGTG